MRTIKQDMAVAFCDDEIGKMRLVFSKYNTFVRVEVWEDKKSVYLEFLGKSEAQDLIDTLQKICE